MSKLIGGKEAKLAWANGDDVEFYSEVLDKWFSLNDYVFLSDVFDTRKLRLKPRTITINGIEVPAPFEPKDGDVVWVISDYRNGCREIQYNKSIYNAFGAWRTEEEIKQVVSALRSVFNGGV